MSKTIKATPHIQVTVDGLIAKTVLMPGDPLRAKYIAETFLENPVCYNGDICRRHADHQHSAGNLRQRLPLLPGDRHGLAGCGDD